MSQQMPPPPPMNYVQPGLAPTRTSAAAVCSLICGILGCFIITGIIAIITGVIGLKATKNPQVKGRGLAIAGLILGIITTLGSGACLVSTGGVAFWAYRQYAPAVQSVTALADAASTGDVDKAMLHVDSNSISKPELQQFIDKVRALGKPVSFVPTHPNINTVNGVTTVGLDGTIVYPNDVKKAVTVELVKQSDGTFKATKLDLE